MGSNAEPPTVFVIDDDRGLIRLIQKALRREGFATAAAYSGKDAIAWLSDHQADLMLLDLKLQDIEGKDLVAHLNAIDRAVPFIVITGQGDERVAVEMMKRGALDYLVKDGDFLAFMPAVVQRALKGIQKEKKLTAAEDALKREHEFVSALLNTSGALVVVLDREGCIVRFNPACERATGYAVAEVQGKRFWDLFLVPEEMAPVKNAFEKLCSGHLPNHYENYWLARDGDRRLIAWSNSALTDDQGSVEYVISVGIDITDRRRLEKEILEVTDLERRRIGQDLHDGLCQHLAGIELMSHALEQTLAKKASTEAAQAAKIAEYVRESIAQTRMLARGLSPVEPEPNGLMSALDELAVSTEKLFKVGCHFRCGTAVLVHDNTVATHIYRIAQEAVSNALRHGKATIIEIGLAAANERMILTVEDNGLGIPAKLPKRKGMGLRIMQYRAGMIGGTLVIQKKAPVGTTVACSVDRQAIRPVLGTKP